MLPALDTLPLTYILHSRPYLNTFFCLKNAILDQIHVSGKKTVSDNNDTMERGCKTFNLYYFFQGSPFDDGNNIFEDEKAFHLFPFALFSLLLAIPLSRPFIFLFPPFLFLKDTSSHSYMLSCSFFFFVCTHFF